jgi:NADPH-dependent 2,4-dienoyl-CoA reductase/sulfur reductase-like enzyme
VALTAAIGCAGAAAADPSQQDQFVALLEQEQIPPIEGEVAGVVARAHQICGQLNGGTPADTLVNDEMNRGYADDPRLRLYPDRVRRTAVRFVTASVSVYCPSHQRELPPYE